ncbi:MAG TPA: efflux RND transporter periplasmic adaptor subunit [Acidobacteriota bacterium]|nr:efflux RND transporter periplasmic adaptor subunit [Acidobacteriota bacterium]
MDEENSKLRSDIEIRPESSNLGSPVIVKDPVTRRFYRFTAVQAAVLELLDGTRSADQIAAAVSKSSRSEVTPDQIREFGGKLRKLLLLDHPACWSKLEAAASPRRRWLSNLLSIKVHAFNPDALLSSLLKRLNFCFGSTFGLLIWLAVGGAVIISVVNWRSLFVSLGTLVSLYSVPLLLIVAFGVMSIHEFAHGLTLKHFGGKVEEMGFLILYFIPAFYCNLSDAWMLKKRERLLVTLAGGYIQLFLWALATLAWRLLAPETFLSRVCLIVIGFSGIQALFNFNPLIKLDGYYLLSDYIEIPNLRAKAWHYIGRRLKGWFLWKDSADNVGVSPREARIYAAFGTASFLFTAGLLALMFDRLGTWLVKEFHTWGVILISALVFAALPISRKEKEKETEVSRFNIPLRIVIRFRKAPRLLILLCVLLVVGLLPWEMKISGDFTIIPNKSVSLSPQVEGILKEIRVDEGDRVRSGDLLAEMENLELSNSYEDTSGELATQEATLQLLKAGARPEEIDKAKRQVETKRAELETAGQVEQELKVLAETVAKKEVSVLNAEANYLRTQKLLKDGLISRNDAERDETAYAVQQKELSEAKGQLKVLEERTDNTKRVKIKELAQAESELRILLAGTRKESIEAMEAEVKKLVDKKNNLAQQLECLKIRSPIQGVVATPHLKNRVGQYLNRGDSFCDIVSEGVVIIDMPVPEKEIADVQAGLPITLKVRGYPSRTFQATVMSIAPVAVEQDLERMVMVQGELKNTDGSLKAGMTGVGKILCGKRMIAQLASRRALRWLRTEFWEYLP